MSSADELINSLRGVDARTFSSEVERARAKEALFAALRRVQSPFDVAMDHVWTEPATTAAIKALIDAGFWKKWVAEGGKPSDIHTLASMTGVDAQLLKRLLRSLAGQHLLTETDADCYALTSYSAALAEEQFPSLYTFLYEMNQPCFANYPKFAAETKYSNPTDPTYSNFQSWKGKDESLFTMLAARSDIGGHFNNTMGVYANAKIAWTEIYPSEHVLSASETDGVLVVDVGGGAGHDLEKFRAKHPNVANGSLVLQDLPNVVETAQVQAPIVAKAHDFFTPEPILGARVYYLHCVLHDWPDEKAISILRNLAKAMKKGYSRILLHENVITPKGSHPRASLSDVVMMMTFSAIERSEKMWQDLVSQAGLEVTKIWATPNSVESIIEIELPSR